MSSSNRITDMGRSRTAAIDTIEARSTARQTTVCALCQRPLGNRTEWHHVVPKSEGGRETVALHPICHRAIHAVASNRELARDYETLDELRQKPELARFLKWIANKPPDFHAPTRRPR